MNPIPSIVTATADAAPPAKGSGFLFGRNGFDFGDLLDILNPLQHIPIVGNLYRQATGDEIGAAARIAGGALFGGPVGAGVAAVTALIDRGQGAPRDFGPGETAQDAIALRDPSAPAGRVANERPGGWMVNAALQPTARLDALAAETADAAPAVAVASAPMQAPGGWLVNAALVARIREAEVATPAVATVPARAERPGGWMVNAAQVALLHETA